MNIKFIHVNKMNLQCKGYLDKFLESPQFNAVQNISPFICVRLIQG